MHKFSKRILFLSFVLVVVFSLCACDFSAIIAKANYNEEELLEQGQLNPSLGNETEAPTDELSGKDDAQPTEPDSDEIVTDDTTESTKESSEPQETTEPTEPQDKENVMEQEEKQEVVPTEPEKKPNVEPEDKETQKESPPKKDKTEEVKPQKPVVEETKPAEPKQEETQPEEPKPEETTPPVEEQKPTEPAPTEPAPTEPEKPKEPVVNYTEVDEYVYVTASSLNIRTGPGTSYSKVASAGRNAKLHRIGIGDNGWSKISYDGKTLYVSSNYLSKDPVPEPKPESSGGKYSSVQDEINKRGITCRLTIPSVGVNVACFWANSNLQSYVDASDSAAFFNYGYQDVIADHRHQGFSAMKGSAIGSYAYLDYGSYKKTYVCVANFKGHNTGSSLTDLEGNDIAYMNEGGIAMYTCNENWQNVTITLWQPA